jgi:preprotein translocase subunit Sss1
MSDSQEHRIAREEEYWTAPKLLGFGLVFLGICIVVIYLMATFSFASTVG